MQREKKANQPPAITKLPFSLWKEMILRGWLNKKDVWELSKTSQFFREQMVKKTFILPALYENKNLTLFNIASWRPNYSSISKKLVYHGHLNVIIDMAVIDQEIILTHDRDNKVRLFEKNNGNLLKTLQILEENIHRVAYLGDHMLAVTSYQHNNILLWDIMKDKLIEQINTQQENPSVFPLNHTQFVTSGWENEIKIWDINSRQCVKAFYCGLLPTSIVNFGKDIIAISAVAKNTIKLWDINKGKLVDEMQGHDGDIENLVLLENGLMASGAKNKTLKIWDIASRECLKTLIGSQSQSHLHYLGFGVIASFAGIGDSDVIELWHIDSGKKTSIKNEGHVTAICGLPNGGIAAGFTPMTTKPFKNYSFEIVNFSPVEIFPQAHQKNNKFG